MNDKWSLGAGVRINYGIFKIKCELSAIDGVGTTKDDETNAAANVKLGVLFELSKKTHFGLTYTSKVNYSFDGDASATLPGPDNRPYSLPFDLVVSAPQQVMFSARGATPTQ